MIPAELCLNLSRITSYTGTLTHTRDIEMESVNLILVDFLQKKNIVAKQLSEHETAEVMLVRNKVKTYMDSELNPVKHNFYDKSRNGFEHLGSINCILYQLGISKENCYNDLSISNVNDFQVHLKRLPNPCFVNTFFRTGLLASEANLEIQPVFNFYKAFTCMCEYLSKTG